MAKQDKFSDQTAETDPNTVEGVNEATANAEANTQPADGKVVKSIVPSKYAGKYKNGGDDALAVFIKEQCTVDGKFDFNKFGELAKINGIDAAKVDGYLAAIAEKKGGAAGRMRMTLRNSMTPLCRADAKGEYKGIKGLDGETYDVKLPPAPQRVKPAETAVETTPAE